MSVREKTPPLLDRSEPLARQWIEGQFPYPARFDSAIILHAIGHFHAHRVTDMIPVNMADDYLDLAIAPDGRICSPVLRTVLTSPQPQLIAPTKDLKDANPYWAEYYRGHGMDTCYLDAMVDLRNSTFTIVALYNFSPNTHHRFQDDAIGGIAIRAHEYFNQKTTSQDEFPQILHSEFLSPAEKRVLAWIREGKTNKEIGNLLSRSPFTVKTHVQKLLAKTGKKNRTQLAQMWVTF
jgi:DNA-binding CsgD family transcriptional regulator